MAEDAQAHVEQSEMERVGRHMAKLLPPNTWVLVYLGEDGQGPLKSVSTLPVEFQRDMVRAVARSFESGSAEQVLSVRLGDVAPDIHHARATLDAFLDELLLIPREFATVTELGGPEIRDTPRWLFNVEVLGRSVLIAMPGFPSCDVRDGMRVGVGSFYWGWSDALQYAARCIEHAPEEESAK